LLPDDLLESRKTDAFGGCQFTADLRQSRKSAFIYLAFWKAHINQRPHRCFDQILLLNALLQIDGIVLCDRLSREVALDPPMRRCPVSP